MTRNYRIDTFAFAFPRENLFAFWIEYNCNHLSCSCRSWCLIMFGSRISTRPLRLTLTTPWWRPLRYSMDAWRNVQSETMAWAIIPTNINYLIFVFSRQMTARLFCLSYEYCRSPNLSFGIWNETKMINRTRRERSSVEIDHFKWHVRIVCASGKIVFAAVEAPQSLNKSRTNSYDKNR